MSAKQYQQKVTGDRWYVAISDTARTGYEVIGWDLEHEPTPDNECGYEIADGPFATEKEAREAMENL